MALYKTYCEFNFLNTVISESLKDFGLLTITMVKSSNQETRHKSKHYSLNNIVKGVRIVSFRVLVGIESMEYLDSRFPDLRFFAFTLLKAKKTGQA